MPRPLRKLTLWMVFNRPLRRLTLHNPVTLLMTTTLELRQSIPLQPGRSRRTRKWQHALTSTRVPPADKLQLDSLCPIPRNCRSTPGNRLKKCYTCLRPLFVTLCRNIIILQKHDGLVPPTVEQIAAASRGIQPLLVVNMIGMTGPLNILSGPSLLVGLGPAKRMYRNLPNC